MKHIVQFDLTYFDGALAGLPICGETVTFPNYKTAQRHASFLQRVERENDFIRAAVTGNRFKPRNVQLFPVRSLVEE